MRDNLYLLAWGEPCWGQRVSQLGERVDERLGVRGATSSTETTALELWETDCFEPQRRAMVSDIHNQENEPGGPGAVRGSVPVDFKLSIIVPAYNEENSVQAVIGSLEGLHLGFDHEILVIDDGSEDRTFELANAFNGTHTKVFQHAVNRGKGAAVRTGIEAATGSHVLIFDADDEYDPQDIAGLVVPLINGRAEVVYGVRLRGNGTIHPTLIHALGNMIMTGTANLLYGSAISDLHTCLKLLPLPLLRDMNLTEEGFGLDTEITAEMLRRGWRPYELPISYVGRSKEEGKKIGAGDAVDCFRILFKVRRRGRTRPGLRDRRLSPPVKLQTGSAEQPRMSGT